MSRTCLTRHIDADHHKVWAVLIDVSRLPEISPSTVHVDGPTALEHVGDTFEQTVKLAGKRFTSTWSVSVFEPLHRLTVEGSVLPGTHYSMTEDLAETGSGGSTLALTIEYSLPFGPLGRLAGRLGAERKALAEAGQVLDGVARLAERAPSDTAAPAHPHP